MKQDKSNKEYYSTYVTFRVTDEMYNTLKKAAEQKHLSVAMYSRQVTLICATKDLKSSN